MHRKRSVWLAVALAIVCSPAFMPARAGAADSELLLLIQELKARVEALEAHVERLEAVVGIADPMSGGPPVGDDQVHTIDASTDWRPAPAGWAYRNAQLQQSAGGPVFIVELKREGGPVAGVLFTVTLYDDSERLLITAPGVIARPTQRGEVKTVSFPVLLTEGEAAAFRLQVDAVY